MGRTQKALQMVPIFFAREHVGLGEFHCESRGHLARCGCLCRLCEDDCDARYWSLVGYSLKALQIVLGPTGASFYLVAMTVTAPVKSSRVPPCAFISSTSFPVVALRH